jgi:PAS domain S-box-containing protein
MNQKTILIIEHDKIIARELQGMLKRNGYGVLEPTEAGEKALRAVTSLGPDLVLMDMDISGDMSSFEMAEQIHSELDIPVIYLTNCGVVSDNLLQQVKLTEPYGYLVRPISEQELLVTIEVSLHRYALDRRCKINEEEYRILVENISDSVWALDPCTFKFIYVSSSAQELAGYAAEEIQAMHPDKLLTPESWERARGHFQGALDAARVGLALEKPLFEIEIIRKDGSKLWLETNYGLVFDESGNIVAIQGASRNITERRRLEETLRKNEKKYRILAETMTDAVWVIDAHTFRFTYISPSAKAAIQYSDEEVIGESPDRFLPRSWDMARGNLQRAITAAQAGLPVENAPFEIELIRKDGSLAWFEVSYNLVCDHSGNVVAIQGANRDITERRKLEETLKEKYRILAETMTDAVWVLDAHTFRFTYASPSAKAAIQYSDEEIIGESPEKFLPRSWDMAKGHLQRAIAAAQAGLPVENVPFEIEIIRKDWSLAWFEVTYNLVFDQSGNVVAIQGANRDVTERRKLEETLRKNEEKYRILAENMTDAVWVLDAHTFRYTYASPSAKAAIQYSDEEIIGESPEKFLPRSWDMTRGHLQRAIASAQAGLPVENVPFEIEIVRRDGSLAWFEVRYNLVFDQSGNVVAIQGANRDVTERRKLEETLRKNEEKYRILAENMTDAVWVIDAHTFRFTYASPSAKAAIQYSDEEIIGESPEKFLPRYWGLAKGHFQRAMSAAQAGLPMENIPFAIEIIRRDGASTWFEVTYNLVFDQSGSVVAIQGANRNITERRKAEQELQESEQQYRTIFENAPSGIFHLTHEGRFVVVNPMMARIFGYSSPEEMVNTVNKSLEELLYLDPGRRSAIFNEVLSRGGWCKYEIPCRCKDGRIITANIAFRRMPHPMKNEAELEGFVEDITDLKLYQSQLKEKLTEIQKLKEQLEKDNVFLKEEVNLLGEHDNIVGESKALKRVLLKVEQVAPTDSIVLIQGETGTGKESIARAIHNMSNQRERALITVNCASLPPSLIESELFGHEKGAYTGALMRMIGRFEAADGSTLFLDEIGELPYELQGKLLRVLELGQFERLGSAKTIQVNVRLIAATNRDLAQEVRNGKFRKDLFYRLNVFPIEIPPLRERKEDIPALVWFFVGQLEKKLGKRIESISQKDIEALQDYSWPGNIRELKNVIEHAMIISGKVLRLRPPTSQIQDRSELYTFDEFQRKYILGILEKTQWRIAGKGGAAELLGMKRTTLYSKLRAMGIRPARLSILKKENVS